MPRGASPKREREYRELSDRFRKEHRYPGREEEVASRIVNKQRARYGETKGAHQQEREGRNPDKDLPIDGYRHLTVGEVKERLPGLKPKQVRKVRDYERGHKRRKTLLAALDDRLGG